MAYEPIPKTMKALVVQTKTKAAVQEISVPSIDDDEILVKIVALAQNPTDWKTLDFFGKTGTICGCDWSGHVVQMGKNVNLFSVGDHVAGCVHGGGYEGHGAFAQYVKTSADLAWKVPEGSISHEEAATMGVGLWTAAQALFHPTRLGLAEPPEKASGEEWVFIYGGSSSVGLFTIQLAHAAGYKVATVASPKNFQLCTSLGADVVFDYKDPDVTSKIKSATNNSLRYALDTISESQTQRLTIQSFGSSPGKMIVILGVNEEAQKLREDVKIQSTLLYTALGREFEFTKGRHYPASPEDKAHMSAFLKKVPGLVASGAVKPNPVKLWEGGLEGINEGLQYMREGKVSGAKIVYKV